MSEPTADDHPPAAAVAAAAAAAAAATPVRLEVDGGVAVVTLADPAHRNTLALEMVTALAAAIDAAVADESVGAIVVTAEPPAFSAGGSLDDLLNPRAPLEEMYVGFQAVAAAPIPTIAAVGGPALGAGAVVALACDVIVCSPAARFEARFLDIGLQPGGGLLWRLRERIGRQGAAAMALCGESIDGPTAERLGLAWRCVPDEDLLATALDLARRAASRPRSLSVPAKATLDATAAVTNGPDAVQLEFGPQQSSMDSPLFRERLEAMRRRVQSQ